MNVKKESLRDKILEYLSNNPSSEVKDIATYVQISKQALYYHIKLLTKQKKIQIVDSQFVNGIEKKFYSLNAAQDPDNTDNQAVLVDDDSSTSSTNPKQKKSPLPQSIDDNTQKTSDLNLDNTSNASNNALDSQNLSPDEPEPIKKDIDPLKANIELTKDSPKNPTSKKHDISKPLDSKISLIDRF